MHNLESAQENETHKFLSNFEIQTDHIISARRLDLLIVDKKKENQPNCGHCRSGWPQDKIDRKLKEREVPRLY